MSTLLRRCVLFLGYGALAASRGGPQLAAAASKFSGRSFPQPTITCKTVEECRSIGWTTKTCLYPWVPPSSTCAPSPTPARGYCTEEVTELHWTEIDTPEFVKIVQKGKVQLIDVREPYELEETGKITPSAINVPLDDVEAALQMSPEEFKTKYGAPQPKKEDTNIVFHCLAGVRSLAALEVAQGLGYTKARHYIRGWQGWEETVDYLKSTNVAGDEK